MTPARFAYAAPRTREEALALLAAHGGEARILAGGQSLVPLMNLRLAAPALLVDINRIAGLDALADDGASVVASATVRHATLLRHAQATGFAVLAQALSLVAHAGIRNRGTPCGSLALADPAAELPALAVALDATVELACVRGLRRVPAADFFRGIYDTALAPDEMIVRVALPRPAPGWRFAVDEVARRPGDYAIAGLVAGVRHEGEAIAEARLVYFALGERPLRARAAEAVLAAGGPLAEAVAALDELDVLGSAEHPASLKRHLAGVLLTRLLARLGGDAHRNPLPRARGRAGEGRAP